MSIILDECMSPDIAKQLYNDFNVVLIRRGASDRDILKLVIILDAYILTKDTKFPHYLKTVY